MLRVLITGFGPFPGMPKNPSAQIAERLAKLRRPRYGGVHRMVCILPTTWSVLDGLPRAVLDLYPDVVLMFGVAGRRRRITPESRAVNRAGMLRTDAVGKRPNGQTILAGQPFVRTGGIDACQLVAKLRQHDIASAVSRDAGDYLCNGLFYRMAGIGVPCIFIHIPRPQRLTIPKQRIKRQRPSMAELERAAEFALDHVVLRIR